MEAKYIDIAYLTAKSPTARNLFDLFLYGFVSGCYTYSDYYTNDKSFLFKKPNLSDLAEKLSVRRPTIYRAYKMLQDFKFIRVKRFSGYNRFFGWVDSYNKDFKYNKLFYNEICIQINTYFVLHKNPNTNQEIVWYEETNNAPREYKDNFLGRYRNGRKK